MQPSVQLLLSRIRVFFTALVITALPVQVWGEDFLISKPTNARTIALCADIILPAYQALGIRAVTLALPARRALHAANSGKTDAELCRIGSISTQYPNLVKVEPALGQLTIVALSIKRLPQIKTLADLKDYKLGSQRGMKAAEHYFKEDIIQYVSSYQQVIQLLDDGLIDYAILTLEILNHAQQRNYRDDFVVHQPPLFQHKLYHYIHKRHQHLVAALTVEITRAKQRRQLQKKLNLP